jgi:hypothetical protein
MMWFFATYWSTELPNGSFQGLHFYKGYDSALMAISSAFINSFSKTCFLTEGPALRIVSAASSGGQGTLGLRLRLDY